MRLWKCQWIVGLLLPCLAGMAEARVVAPSPQPRAELGISQANAGGWLVLGSPGEGSDQGAVQVYSCSGEPCAATQRLAPAEGLPADRFGLAVALTATRLAVAAPGRQGGAVYLHSLDAGMWNFQQRLDAPAPGSEGFGTAVALVGSRLFVGAPAADLGAGAVYVYTEQAGTWTLQARLDADDAQAGAGFGAALASDGPSLLVGAPSATDGLPGSYAQGAAYLLDGNAPHAQLARLVDPGATLGARFGSAVAVDGARALIGSPKAAAGAGQAYAFERVGGLWQFDAALGAVDGLPGDRLGVAVSLLGSRALLGAPFALGGCGRVLLSNHDGLNWGAPAQIPLAPAVGGQLLGWSVGLDGAVVVAGAPGFAGGNSHQGAAERYDLADRLFNGEFEAVEPVACVLP